MNYRIKTKTYNDGQKEYLPQKRVWGIWINVMNDGQLSLGDFPCVSKNDAMRAIDKNYNKPDKLESTEVEYVVKGFFKAEKVK